MIYKSSAIICCNSGMAAYWREGNQKLVSLSRFRLLDDLYHMINTGNTGLEGERILPLARYTRFNLFEALESLSF